MNNTRAFLSRFIFPVTLFFVGFSALVLEITGARILSPYFGSTVYVWTSMIGSTLLGLSAGYFFGGRMADRLLDKKIIAWGLLLTSILVLLIPVIDSFVLLALVNMGQLLGPLFSSLALFFLPAIFFGSFGPIAVKLLLSDISRVGKTTGNVYASETVGGIFGTFISGFILLSFFRIDTIFLMTGSLLVLLSLIWFLYE